MLEEGERIEDERERRAALAGLLVCGARELLFDRLHAVLAELERTVARSGYWDRRLEELQEMLIREFRAAAS